MKRKKKQANIVEIKATIPNAALSAHDLIERRHLLKTDLFCAHCGRLRAWKWIGGIWEKLDDGGPCLCQRVVAAEQTAERVIKARAVRDKALPPPAWQLNSLHGKQEATLRVGNPNQHPTIYLSAYCNSEEEAKWFKTLVAELCKSSGRAKQKITGRKRR